MKQIGLLIDNMVFNFGNDSIQKWFNYIYNICKDSKCEHCEFVNGKQKKTDIGILFCETGANRTMGDDDERRTGKDNNQQD